MAIGEAIANFRNETGMSQREVAERLHFDRSMVSRIENGKLAWPEVHDANLASLSWKLALKVADERTGGYISNLLEDVPNLDLHPAALKEQLLKDLDEAGQALEELRMSRHIPKEQRQASAEKFWKEITDVMQIASVMRGVVEEEFGLDRKALIKKHELEVKQGRR